MKVIMLRDVAGVGQKGAVKDVSDGYALNHLIPNRMAQMATADVLKRHTEHAAEDKARREEQEKEWYAIAEKMKKFTLMVRANASQQGHLYKKISSEDIARLLLEQGVDVPPESIQPKMPIKQAGMWPVDIKLGDKLATITVEVIAS